MTTPLFSEKQALLEGRLSKPEFIATMHERYHQLLFAYSHYIKETDIARIEITDDSVIMVTRQHGFKLLCNPHDQRTVPIEILNFGAYEQEELECIFNLLSSTSVILDIGANCGYYSCIWHAITRQARCTPSSLSLPLSRICREIWI